jgi:hypothetical protein
MPIVASAPWSQSGVARERVLVAEDDLVARLIEGDLKGGPGTGFLDAPVRAIGIGSPAGAIVSSKRVCTTSSRVTSTSSVSGSLPGGSRIGTVCTGS